jgi:hypothetical protein
MKTPLLAIACLLAWSSAQASSPCVVPPKATKSTAIPLCFAKQRIREILAEYNNDPRTVNNGLPPLRKAEVNFKTVVTKKTGLTVSVLVFTGGVTHQNDLTKEVTDAWDVPQAPPNKGFTSTESYVGWLEKRKRNNSKFDDHDFAREFRAFIDQIAAQEKNELPDIPDQQHTVTISESFGVQWNFKAGLTLPIHLVTLGPSAEKNRSDTQSVKLTFANKPPKE